MSRSRGDEVGCSDFIAPFDFVVGGGLWPSAFGASYDLRLSLRALHVIGCSPSQDAVEGWEAGGGGGELVGVLVWHEVDVVEEELVEHPPDVVWYLVVGSGRVLGQVKRLGDEHLFVGEVVLEGLDVLGGPVQVLGDAVLLSLQDVEGDGVFVVSLEELGLLVQSFDLILDEVSQVERGQRNLSLHNIVRIAKGLESDPGELVRGLEE